jgi:hypothetical protein
MVSLCKIIITITTLLSALIACNSRHKSHEQTKKSSDGVKISSSSLSELASRFNSGKQIFSGNCNSCHPAPEKHFLDQYLFEGIFERLPPPGEQYFIQFIQDSKNLKASGDPYARAIDSVYGSEYEHHFKETLQEKDYYDIILYIKVADRQRNRGTSGSR